MKPVVSVIMPAFNVEDYIGESIRSVCRQTFRKWELIVIDDGSTDATPDIIRPFLLEEPRIVYHRQDNQGVAAGRNQGVLLAKGDFIAFLDADDLWNSSFLQKLMSVHEGRPTDCVCAYSNQLMPDGMIQEYSTPKPDLHGNILIPFLKKEIIVNVNALVISKEVLFKNGISFTNGCIMGEDTEFKCKVFAVCTVQCLPEVLMTYRQRPGSITQQRWNWETYYHSMKALKRGVTFVKENYHGNNYGVVVEECLNQLHFRRYRFLYFMIKYGFFPELRALLTDPEWQVSLDSIRKGKFEFSDRMKAYLILKGPNWVWRIYYRRSQRSGRKIE